MHKILPGDLLTGDTWNGLFHRLSSKHGVATEVTWLKKADDTPRLTTNFNTQWHDLRSILKKHWEVLRTDPCLASVLPMETTLTAKRAPSQRDQITRSHFSLKPMRLGRGTQLVGTHPSGGCSICPFMIPTTTFVNPSTGDRIHNYINCKDKMVKYGPCPKLYIGQTSQQLRKRIQKHVSSINLASRDAGLVKKLTSVAEHNRYMEVSVLISGL